LNLSIAHEFLDNANIVDGHCSDFVEAIRVFDSLGGGGLVERSIMHAVDIKFSIICLATLHDNAKGDSYLSLAIRVEPWTEWED
jgi:hypothetical protein